MGFRLLKRPAGPMNARLSGTEQEGYNGRVTDWKKIRKDFQVTETCAYFQSAGMSPLPRPVFEAIKAGYERLFREGDIHWPDDMDRYRALCRRLAGMLNAGPDDVTFAPNSSTAMGILGLSLKERIEPPFHIVSMQDEFPASTVAFEYLGIPMRYVQPRAGRYPLSAVLDMTDKQTAAVITSFVQYATGFRQDLLTLGRELNKRGILLGVNATQGFPYYPIDVRAMGIDALTASLHKWGLTGHVGALFYTSAAFRERFPPPLAGWLSIDSPAGEGIPIAKNVPFKLFDSARRYEMGTFNLILLLALSAALDYMESIGFELIRLRLKELTDALIAGLKSLGISIVSPVVREEERSAIVSFTLGDRNGECVKMLEDKKVYVSLRAGLVRISVNIFNDVNDIDRLLAALKSR